MSSCTELIETR